MKYLILIHSNPHFEERWAALTEEQRAEFGPRHYAITDELAAGGELVASEGLADPNLGRRVTRSGAETLVSDGPFAEAKEHLAGFYLIDCENEETAPSRSPPRCQTPSGAGRGPSRSRSQRVGHVTDPGLELLLREAAPTVLGVLVRRHGGFDVCEDAVQEALLAAARSWPVDGTPANPTGWLITTATRRLIETWRSDGARRNREQAYTRAAAPTAPASESDDTLALFFLCCHPALTIPSQVALTLRAVGGLTTAQIAHALLVPEATLAQRISRAKARIKAAGGHSPATCPNGITCSSGPGGSPPRTETGTQAFVARWGRIIAAGVMCFDMHMVAVVQVNFVVADLDRSQEFYQRLGFAFHSRGRQGVESVEAWVSTEAGITVVLHSPEFASWWDSSTPGPAAGGPEIDFQLDSAQGLDEVVAELGTSGATITKQLVDMPWGQRFAIVIDPDGYRIGLKAPLAVTG